MGTMKTPGVYIVEKNAFPNSVVEVATAVPAFIGYTEQADNKGKSLSKKPWRITSMAEYHSYYGGAPEPKFNIVKKGDLKPPNANAEAEFTGKDENKTEYVLQLGGGNYLFYRCMKLFYKNSGGPCYVVSVGKYDDAGVKPKNLTAGIDPLIKEQEPTMVVIPETVLLDEDVAIGVQQEALKHCGEVMENRFAILDIWGGDKDRKDPGGDCIESFRSKLGINNLNFAAAYYPWVNTTIVDDTEVSFDNIENKPLLQTLLREEMGEVQPPKDPKKPTPEEVKAASQALAIDAITDLSLLRTAAAPKKSDDDKKAPKGGGDAPPPTDAANAEDDTDALKVMLDNTLTTISPLYKSIVDAMKLRLNLLPPAAAMAGIYTMVDNSRGVWKAPANVSLNVVSPAVNITHSDQEDLNVTTQGKSINAIRSFIGEGTLVWGARTLDGNSLDWRYINVRRTMIMLEESIRLASKAYVFEPNDANTWVTMKSMIRNFLTGIWKRGGLAGAVPDDAFSVHVGLGETMTSEDILEGILRITVLVAISRPAEFIEITFQQQMQKS